MNHNRARLGFIIGLTLLFTVMVAMPAQAQTPPYEGTLEAVDTDDNPVLPALSAPDCTTVPGNPFVNCSFEVDPDSSPPTGWVVVNPIPLFCTPVVTVSGGASCGFGFFATTPTQGSKVAFTDFDGGGPGTIRLCQDVTLPSAALLEFDYRGAWNMTFGATLDRTFDVTVEPSGGGAPLLGVEILRAVAPTVDTDTGPLTAAVDISGAGSGARRVCFDWFIPEPFTGPGQFQVDNVSVVSAGPVADLALTKTVNTLTPGFGDIVTFTVRVSNNGPDDVDDIEVTDVLPPGLIFDGSAATQGGYNPVLGLWDVGMVVAGASATLTIDAVVDAFDPVTNTATITASNATDSDPSNDSDSATITPQVADLAIDKTVDNAAPAIGDQVNFTITISHLDGADVTTVRVEDVLPDGTSFVSSTTTQGSYNAGTGAWNVGSLTEGQMETLVITVEVTATAPITNVAFIAFSSQHDPFTGDNSDAASLNAVAADLEVEKQVVDFSSADGTNTATFEVTVSNEGPSGADGVVVTDNLSPDMTVVSFSASQGAAVSTPSVLTWDVGTLADGGAATLTVTVTVPVGGSLLNTAEVTAADLPDPDSEPDDGEGDDFAAATAGARAAPDFVPGAGPGGIVNRGNRFAADLALTKDVTVDGGNAVYTIMVENLGPQSTAKVEVTDHLPACLSYDSSTADQGAYDPDTWTWSIGTLKVGEKVTLEITASIGDSCTGEVVNTATITSSSLPDPSDFFTLFDEPPATANNSDDASFTVSATNGRVLEEERVLLGTNYPNPFNPETMIPYRIEEATYVSIRVYDLLGRTVATLVDGTVAAGAHQVRFEAGHLPTGMYLVRMEAGGIVQTQHITLMK